MKLCQLAAIGVSLFLTGLPNVSAQERKLPAPTFPFPLPTRNERLAEEAQKPETELARLLELLQHPSDRVRTAAVQALGERGDLSVIPALEKARMPLNDLPTAIDMAIARINERHNVPTPANNNQALADNLFASLKDVTPRSPAFRSTSYSGSLVRLARLKDERSLPLIEQYLKVRPTSPHDPLTRNRQISDNRLLLERLYWRVRLKSMTLEQMLVLFKEVTEDTKKVPVNTLGFEDVLLEFGAKVITPIAALLHDKTQAKETRVVSARILMQIQHPDATAALEHVVDDPTDSEYFRDLLLKMLGYQCAHPRAIKLTIAKLQEGLLDDKMTVPLINAMWQVETLAKAGADKQALEDAILPYLKFADWSKGSDLAAMLTSTVGSAKSVDPLIKIIEKGTAPSQEQLDSMRRSAITSLGFVGKYDPAKVILFLADKADHSTAFERIPIVQALSRVGDKVVIPVLLDLALKEKDSTALWFEVSGIYLAGGKDAVAALRLLQESAKTSANAWLLELTEEGLLRVEKEKRTE
jgi:HEAT repeat protein